MDSAPLGTGQLEDTLHQGKLGIRPNGRRFRPAADQHFDRIQDDRLPRTGFTGQDDQAGTRAEFQLVDNGKIFDPQFGQHIT